MTYIQVLCLGPWLRYQCEDGGAEGAGMRGELEVQLSRAVNQEMCVDRRGASEGTRAKFNATFREKTVPLSSLQPSLAVRVATCRNLPSAAASTVQSHVSPWLGRKAGTKPQCPKVSP